MEKTAIYGGTFAPVHIGHVRAAKEFFKAVKPDRLLIIPTLIPPHKQITFRDNPVDRLNMLHLAFDDDSFFEGKLTVSDYELNSPPPSYTVNTLRHFSAPDRKLIFLVGTDMYVTLDKWREPEEIFKLCTVALMKREKESDKISAIVDDKTFVFRNKYNADIIFIEAPAIEISSSQIRNGSDSLRKKYHPPQVYDYIKEFGLYADK